MADVTGPIPTLPGATHAVPEGIMCDDHPDRPAYRRVQGETDSFGSEMIDMCQECYKDHQHEVKNADTSGCCDWCKTMASRLTKRRNVDEGMAGPVYDVCSACIKRDNERLDDELEELGYYDCDD